ncbi:MAG: biotin--[acetyl-CoA-carboxylase] ligase [Bacteroidia bacterium]|nr:biotin--[acetyl-CoA-carboxylase] ligase [Bacteroidia bacterium]
MSSCQNKLEFDWIQLDETESTNLYLHRLSAAQPMKEWSVVTADYQSGGRGQRGNSWESEAQANLLFSCLLFPRFLKAQEQFYISQIISLAIKEALSLYTEGISIKWPNDIYWHEKKICGILIEHNLTGMYLEQSIIGVGLNVNQVTFRSNAPNPVSLSQITGEVYNRATVLSDIMDRLHHYYGLLTEQKKEWIRMRYHEALFRQEGFHSFQDASGVFQAKLVEVGCDGKLTLQTPSAEYRSYYFKEVQFVL